jgi:hypothetical protein
MRRKFCQACSFARRGVKTRIEIPHTCDEGKAPNYEHNDLMWDINDLFSRMKWHLHPPIAIRGGPLKPGTKEIDELMDRILEVLER